MDPGELEAGTKVRCINDVDHHYLQVGEVMRVAPHHNGGYPYGCRFEGRNFLEWYGADELEVVPE